MNSFLNQHLKIKNFDQAFSDECIPSEIEKEDRPENATHFILTTLFFLSKF
jgi:hypothetical protein